MAQKKIAVIGAGVGGLASAARLASRGHCVDVFEKLPCCGGRNNIISDRGFLFDTGPSFVLMPDFFEEVFTYCKENIRDYLDLAVLERHYKIFYSDGRCLTIHKDPVLTKQELECFEPHAAQRYDDFLAETKSIYQNLEPLLYRCFTARDLLDPRMWGLVGKIRAFSTYWKIAQKYFKSRELCFAMTFEAMFIGVSPYQAPGFYSIITYTDHCQKIRHPMGGMYQIPRALERLGKKFGARYHYDSEVTKISPNGGVFFETKQGTHHADCAVLNADYAYAQKELLGKTLPKYAYSCSVLLLYLGLNTKVAGLEHHNLFFSGDLEKNLAQIFQDKTTPTDPSFYIHVPTVTDASLAPAGKDILYILIPVQNLENAREDAEAMQEMLRKKVFDKVQKICGIDLEPLIEVEHRFYPHDFISRYNILFGATFGLAHTFLQSAFFRPVNRDRRHKNIYFVGASTQPGGGLPVVLAGSRIVADMIERAG